MLTHLSAQWGLAVTTAILVFTGWAGAQTETITGQPIGMDTQLVFPHTSLPGATGIDFSFTGGFSPTYPIGDTHGVVTDFEWGPTAAGPWTTSPDNFNTVHGGMTEPILTGIYHGPADAPFVAIHFYAGGIMFVSGSFVHTSVFPEPASAALIGAGVLSLFRRRRSGARSGL